MFFLIFFPVNGCDFEDSPLPRAIDPATKHPDLSVAISVIEKSAPHYHKVATEEYEVLSGEVTLFLGEEKMVLKPGDKVIIKPGTIHWARSKSGWIKCTSKPGWIPGDHVLAEKELD